LQGGKNRFHPTQKGFSPDEALIRKLSNENDVVLDTFLEGSTTLSACQSTKRQQRMRNKPRILFKCLGFFESIK